MSGWIKVEKDLLTDPRILRIAALFSTQYEFNPHPPANGVVQSSRNARPLPGVMLVLGGLVQLWMIADTHIGQDDVLPLGVDEINHILGMEGFCEFLPGDWLEVLDSDHVKLPGYHRHNGTIAKERAQNARRVAKHRKSNSTRNGTPLHAVTPKPLPDRDQDRDLYQDPDPKKEGMQGETRAARSTAARLPEDWQLTKDRQAIAEQEGADAARTFANFTDYWKAAGGQKARKHDWDAAWRIWCRREGDTRQKPRKTRFEEIVGPLEARIRNG